MARVARRLALAVFVACAIGDTLMAQGGYSPDVLPRGTIAASLDGQVYRGGSGSEDWLWVLPGTTLGLGGGVDAGLRLSLFQPRQGPAVNDVVPQIRWRAWADSARALRAGVAVIGLIPAGGTVAGHRPRAYLTATGAWTAPTGTNVTLGAWQGVRIALDPTEAQRGVIVEAAQPLDRARRTNVAASWFSGRTYFGYLTVGVSRTFKRQTLFVGWARGNDPRFNSGPTVSWSWLRP